MNVAQRSSLSQLDAFFVAYQERGGILMQLGVEVEVTGEPSREALEQALTNVTRRWPALGQVLHRRIAGLAWTGECRVSRMLRTARDNKDGLVHQWRNTPIDPFREPPFQMLAIFKERSTTLAFRAHHSVCDGEALVRVSIAVVRALAQILGGQNLDAPARAANISVGSVVFPSVKLQWRRWFAMGAYLRRLEALRRNAPGAPLAVRRREPGDISTCERTLDPSAIAQFLPGDGLRSPALPWLCAAAWARAIGSWNQAKRSTHGVGVSLEVPISLRSTRPAREAIGNFISPLILFADATRPLKEIAGDLQAQFRRGTRQRSHLAVPLFTTPARYLPWPLFRRLALNPMTTGFATSHFTWLEEEGDIYGDVPSLSDGRLRLLEHHIFAPVCLHMGAALTVFVVSGRVKLCVTYRETAFVRTEAEALLDLLLAELNNATALRASMPR